LSGKYPRRWRALSVCVLAAVTALAAILAPASEAKRKKSAPSLTVMTRNLYLGGDIFAPISSATEQEFRQKASKLWADVQHTNFPKRAKLIAKEIKRNKPDLVGLQELALWRKGPQGVTDGSTTHAKKVVYDFKALLLKELKKQGLKYKVGVEQREADIEASTSLGYDVRLTMRDAILVKRKRNGFKIRKRSHKHYKTDITVPTKGGIFTSRRGWVALDLGYRGKRFRFVDTHTEAAAASIRQAQAKELVAKGGPLRKKGTVILVGDLNSDPKARGGTDSQTYDTIIQGGYKDAWDLAKGGKGLSCCHKPLLDDKTSAGFDQRIDDVLVKPRLKASKPRQVGKRASERSGGLWASDHAGTVIKLRLK
jgi:endonuclease/exonuclease/phosphatase family metal-dependent hydrolase